MNKIFYGFGRDYLKNWGVNEALREIYQNFLDYGDYEENNNHGNSETDGDLMYVDITNAWEPEGLDFLRIGNSNKNNPDAIGKHGEGLKLAFLILLREGYSSEIITPKFKVRPAFYSDKEIGECFCFEYEEHGLNGHPYQVRFTCDAGKFNAFKNNIVMPSDIVFDDNYYGSVVNKPSGNIYSGRLFVCHQENVGKAYNIKPHHLPLDRDRQVPKSLDVSWSTSKINSAYGKWSAKDMSCSDTAYVDEVPEEVKKNIEPKIVGNSVQFTIKDEKGEDQVITNSSVNEALKRDSFFTSAIKRLKMYLAKKLGLYELLVEFKKKHVHSADAIADFDVILERISVEQPVEQ